MTTTTSTVSVPGPSAAERDAADPLADFPARFVQADGVHSYLDGNSLGRPVAATANRIAEFIAHDWGNRLIRSWDENWFELPVTLGDRLASSVLGAAAGQTIVADSTTVLLYKLARAGVAARAGRTEIVIDDDSFPTDRFVVEGIAAECGLTISWIRVDTAAGVTPDLVAAAVSERTALVVLSHVAYRSGFLADLPAITAVVHEAGALMLWDLCHSAGAVTIDLDSAGVDLAVGCTYKYLNGGPGSPAFAFVNSAIQDTIEQPIWGWMGAADVFAMADHYQPANGMRRFLSGTPPIVGALAMTDMLDLIDEAGISAIRTKSIALTEFVIDFADRRLVPLGATVASPRIVERRGSHVTLRHPLFRAVTAELWRRGVIPDFRAPDGLRIGLSPLSTSFAELERGLTEVELVLTEFRDTSSGEPALR